MIVITKRVVLDDLLQTDPLHGYTFTNENGGHRFVITCVRGGQELTLTGTITLRFLRADGTTVYLAEDAGTGHTGYTSIDEDGHAVVTLHQDCYNVPGQFRLSVYNVVDGTSSVIYSATGNVQRTQGGTLIDSGGIVPDLDQLIETATQAAEDAQTALSQATAVVSYAEQTGKTDAQKAQARTNIGAADANLTDTVVENVPYNGADGSVTDGRTLTRVGTVYTLDGSASGNRRFKLSSDLAATSSADVQNAWPFEVVLEGGETYTMRVEPISGTLSGSTSLVMRAEDASENLFSMAISGGAHTFTWPDGTKKGKIVLFVPGTTTTTAYKFRLLLYKDSMARLESDLAPMEDSATASAAHTAGSLLMMGGQLYKATAAIASGETITPGSSGNVAATSVAAEFTPEITRLTLASGASSDIVDTNFNRWSYCCRIGRIVLVYLFMGMRSLPADDTVITTVPDSCKPADFYQVIQSAYNSDKNILLKVNENGSITMHRTNMSTGADTFIACFHYILT